MHEITKEWMIYRTPSALQDGVCAIEILMLSDGRKAVILEELEENPGLSVSLAWEAVVATVHEKYGISPPAAVWIEHNSNPMRTSEGLMPKWQLVTFRQPPPGKKTGDVQWREMTAEDWRELGLEPRR